MKRQKLQCSGRKAIRRSDEKHSGRENLAAAFYFACLAQLFASYGNFVFVPDEPHDDEVK